MNTTADKKFTNCYIYAFDDDAAGIVEKPTPGFKRGHFRMRPANAPLAYLNCANLIHGVIEDYPRAKFIGMLDDYEDLRRVVLPNGSHLVYLVVDDTVTDESKMIDFHFYKSRPGNPMSWTHKPGELDVSSVDALGRIITDPRHANHHYPFFNCTKACGFFIVPSPIA